MRFPQGFLWGAATSAHQVEGGNWNSDWWAWEHDPVTPTAVPSGDACDHYHRYPDDIALLADLGFNAYRFSIEWARIEPEEGEFSLAALDHYRRVLITCRDHGVEPVVTLNHFTLPRWVADNGGWAWDQASERFARYCTRVGDTVGDHLGWVCTINEPNVVVVLGYLHGFFPPGQRHASLFELAQDNVIAGHQTGVDAIRATAPDARVGLTLAMSEWAAEEGGEDRLERLRARWEDVYLDATDGDDFVGVQTYSRNLVGAEDPTAATGSEAARDLPAATVLGMDRPDGIRRTQMGYEFRPHALAATVRRAVEVTGLPVLVTENGIATTDDAERVEFTAAALAGLHSCLGDDLDVRGYLHWSLLDNFEWSAGYEPRFGLVAVDRETFTRHPKPSARWLGDVARRNALDDAG